MTTNILIAVGFFLSLIGLSYLGRGSGEGHHFLIGNRRVGVFQTATALVAGFRDGAGLAVWVALAIGLGFGALWLWVGLAVALISVSILAPRVRRRAIASGAYSLNGWLEDAIGPLTGRLAVIIISITAFLYAGAQFAVSAGIASSLFGIEAVVAVAAVGVTICIYISIGGYLSVIRTDVLQWAIITFICIAIPIQIAGGMPDVPQLSTVVIPSASLTFGLFAISFLVTFSGADTWQRTMSAISPQAARLSPLLAAALYFVISVALVVFGHNIGLAYPQLPAEQAFVRLFDILEQSSLVWAALGLLVAASAISTIDTQVYLFATAVAPAVTRAPELSRQVVLVRILSIVFTVGTGLVALTVKDIVEFLFSAVTLITILAPLILFAWYTKTRSKIGDLISVVSASLASVVYAVMFAQGMFQNVVLTVVPSLVCAVLLIIGLAAARVMMGRRPSETS